MSSTTREITFPVVLNTDDPKVLRTERLTIEVDADASQEEIVEAVKKARDEAEA